MKQLGDIFKSRVRTLFSPTYLLITNTTLCCSLLSIGDSINQIMNLIRDERKRKDYDFGRNARVTGTGIALGPMNHYWYKWLDKVLPGRVWRCVFGKVAMDLVSCPAFSSTFVVGVTLMEGRTFSQAADEYTRKYRSIFMLDIMIWPPSQLLNFLLLPPQTRVLYTSVVQVFYNSLITAVKHDVEKEKDAGEGGDDTGGIQPPIH